MRFDADFHALVNAPVWILLMLPPFEPTSISPFVFPCSSLLADPGVYAQQGNKEEVEEAERLFEEVNKALAESEARASEARQALNEAQAAEAEAKV